MLTLFAPDDAATAAIGAALVPALQPGDVLTLSGDLGAGKTALARAIIRSILDAPDLEVPSPSFAIVQPYDGIVHADLYRLADEAELFELGILEDEKAILLVEWAQNAPLLFERPGLRLELSIPPSGGRRITITAQDGRDLTPLAAMLAPWRSAEAH